MTPFRGSVFQWPARFDRLITHVARTEEAAMSIYHLTEVPGGWSVAVAREGAGWRVEDATHREGSGSLRVIAPLPISELVHSSHTTAIKAAVDWLREERLL